MRMNYQALSLKLPSEALTWQGFGGALNLNFVRLTGEAVTPESSAIEGLLKLLAAAHAMQDDINADREPSNQAPLEIVTRVIEVDNDAGKAYVSYVLKAEINLEAALNQVIDPTEPIIA